MAVPLPKNVPLPATHSDDFFGAAVTACQELDKAKIEQLADELAELRTAGGRLFVLGVGGSAGNAGHAVNDFRKLCGIEAYAPSDNVSELTARANDEGWATIFSGWLKVSNLSAKDALLIFSVGGGNEARNISPNLIEAIKLAQSVGAKIFGVVGREDGYTAQYADIAICIPIIDEKWVTPISEAFQAVVWHSLVSNPKLQSSKTKW